jgi:hypothetical protein
MNELIFNKDFDEIDWLKRVDGEKSGGKYEK